MSLLRVVVVSDAQSRGPEENVPRILGLFMIEVKTGACGEIALDTFCLLCTSARWFLVFRSATPSTKLPSRPASCNRLGFKDTKRGKHAMSIGNSQVALGLFTAFLGTLVFTVSNSH